MKRPYLAVHDYGMGGIWMYIDAADRRDVERAYPELQVFEAPPQFLTPGKLRQIEQEMHFDVDAPPSGYLADIVASRDDA